METGLEQGVEWLSGGSGGVKAKVIRLGVKNGAVRVVWQLMEQGPVPPTTFRTPEPVLILPHPEIWRSRAWVQGEGGTLPWTEMTTLLPALQDPHEAPGHHFSPRAVMSLLSTFSPSKSIFISNYKRQSQSR